MYVLRIALVCALFGWMTADAHAQLGTYGAPDPISWSQDNTPVGSRPMLAARTAYVSTADGSVSAQPMPPRDNSALGPMLSQPGPGPAIPPAPGPAIPPAANAETNMLPQGGYFKDAGNCDACSDCGCGNCCSNWYASFEFLYMGRNKPNNLYTSADWNSQDRQGNFDTFDWSPGGQVTLGYRFGCCCDWAVEGSYWGLSSAQSDGDPQVDWSSPQHWYVSALPMGNVSLLGTVGNGPNGTSSGSDYTDQSPYNHIWRDWQAQNVELNLVKNICGGNCSRLSADFLVGVRWFRFQDGLVFGAQRNPLNTPPGVPVAQNPYANDMLFIDDHITNDLVGVQMGFDLGYRFCDSWKAFVRPEFGIYDDHMQLNYNMYAVSAATGQQYQASSPTYPNANYPVNASTDGFSFLTQVDVGLEWQVTNHFAVNGGYRVVAATGIGLSDNQVPFNGNDSLEAWNIDRNGSLVLHGAFAGMTFTW